MEANTSRAEAERLLGVAEKLLQNRDLNGSRDFAVLAQETEPLLDGSDQILSVVDVLLAAERRINNHHDWYGILQVDSRSNDQDLIKRQYRRLALLLHPDKNKFAFADQAFRLVAQAWAVLSDVVKKPLYDNELNLFSKIDLTTTATTTAASSSLQNKLPVRRTTQPPEASAAARSGNSARNEGSRLQSFWTVCPYCYVLYEYPRVYEDCCLKCQKCQKAFHAAVIPSMPPMVPGQDAYYCCWAFFPLGFVLGNSENGDGGGGKSSGPVPAAPGFPNWMPPMFQAAENEIRKRGKAAARVRNTGAGETTAPRKRGRPRLYF